MQNNNIVIETHELTRRFGDFTAVDAITFEVSAGEIFGFLGANGAGKTTAMRILCGLLSPTSGKARVAGYDVYTESELKNFVLNGYPASPANCFFRRTHRRR